MRNRATQFLLSAVFLLLAFTASASPTPPPLPDFPDAELAQSLSAVPAQAAAAAVDWSALEAENAVLAVLLIPLDDPENAYVALIPCDPQNRVYRLFRDLQPPLGLRAYGNDFAGPLRPWDWRVDNYTQAEVDRVYAVLAQRDRHIYNPGLANTSQTRESSRRLLEETLGVPVRVAWNPTFRRLGVEVSAMGDSIGGNGWSWNPFRLMGNVLRPAAKMTGIALQTAGVVLDVAVAGAEKTPVVGQLEPTFLHSMHLYREALEHVMSQPEEEGPARVYGWMHSEGAIHGGNVLRSLHDEPRRFVTARTFGAGGYMFGEADVTHYANFNLHNNWFLRRDIVPQLAGLNVVRRLERRGELEWMETDREGWVHGIETYVQSVIIDLARAYFDENAERAIRQ